MKLLVLVRQERGCASPAEPEPRPVVADQLGNAEQGSGHRIILAPLPVIGSRKDVHGPAHPLEPSALEQAAGAAPVISRAMAWAVQTVPVKRLQWVLDFVGIELA